MSEEKLLKGIYELELLRLKYSKNLLEMEISMINEMMDGAKKLLSPASESREE